MRWQDIVFTAGSLTFLVALIPMLRSPSKPPLASSVPVALWLYVFSLTYLTLGFVAAPLIEFVQASLWLTLSIQRWKQCSSSTTPGHGTGTAP